MSILHGDFSLFWRLTHCVRGSTMRVITFMSTPCIRE